MSEPSIRFYILRADGSAEDTKEDFPLSNFAGQVPAPGDVILYPGVRQGLDRFDPKNRRFWTVVRRVFNPRDLEDHILIMVNERAGEAGDQNVIG